MQFQNGPQIDVRLTRPRLHFHGEVAGIQRRGGRQAVAQLDGVQVVENRVVGQGQPVARAEVVFGQGEPCLALRGVRRDGELGTADLLAAEQVANGVDGLQLEVEVRLEVEFHACVAKYGRLLHPWELHAG